MIRGRGSCVSCNRTTWNSKSGLCRKCWAKRAWEKDTEYTRVYTNGKTDGGEIIDTSQIRLARGER